MKYKMNRWMAFALIVCVLLVTMGCDELLNPPVDVTGVTITQDNQTLVVGDTVELAATVAPSDATNKDVTWSSDDEEIATVSSSGVVTAVAVGEATITVTTDDGEFVDSIIITVENELIQYGSTVSVDLDQTVAFGTSETDALAALASTIAVTGSEGENGTATIGWTIANYDGSTAGNYTATGNITLPTGWEGSPATATATITVNNANTQIQYASTASVDFDQTVDFGTSETDALAALASTIAVTGSEGENGTATIAWSIADYDLSAPGSYNATGTITLPNGWEGEPNTISTTITISPYIISIPGEDAAFISQFLFTKEINLVNDKPAYSYVVPKDFFGEGSPEMTIYIYFQPVSEDIQLESDSWVITTNVLATTDEREVTYFAPHTIGQDIPPVSGWEEYIIEATDISFTEDLITLDQGEEYYLEEVISLTPNYASAASLVWTSDTTMVATVDNTGTVTAIGAGSATITATTADGSESDTITVIVSPDNTAPVASDDNTTVNENATTLVDVLANDSDVDSDTLSITSFTQGSNGAVAQEGDSLRYTPDSDYNGADSFTYTISDGNGGTDTATVSVTVNAINDAPVAVNDSVTVNEDATVLMDVLVNDTDVEGDTLSITGFTQGTNGTVTQEGDSLRYTPDSDYNGSDSFMYEISDGNGGIDTATVNITVKTINDAPAAVNDSVTVNEDATVLMDVLVNDTDVEGDTLSISSFTQGSHGTVAQEGDSLRYTPDANYNGADSFTYTISDGNGGTDTATVNITVNAIAVINVTITEDDQTILVGDTLQLSETVAPSDASNKDVTWSSSDTGVATVSTTGLVTAVAAGSATITVTTDDGSKENSIEITVSAGYIRGTITPLDDNTLNTLTLNLDSGLTMADGIPIAVYLPEGYSPTGNASVMIVGTSELAYQEDGDGDFQRQLGEGDVDKSLDSFNITVDGNFSTLSENTTITATHHNLMRQNSSGEDTFYSQVIGENYLIINFSSITETSLVGTISGDIYHYVDSSLSDQVGDEDKYSLDFEFAVQRHVLEM